MIFFNFLIFVRCFFVVAYFLVVVVVMVMVVVVVVVVMVVVVSGGRDVDGGKVDQREAGELIM